MNIISNFVIRFAKPIVIVWSLLLVVFAFFALSLPSKLKGDGFYYEGEHVYVKNELAHLFNIPTDQIFVLFEGQNDEKITAVLSDLSKLDGITDIISPLDNPSLQNAQESYAVLNYEGDASTYAQIVKDVRSITSEEQNVSITGAPVINVDINEASQKDLIQAEAIGIPIALLVLLLAFGTIVASLLPIIIGAATVVITLGIMSIISDSINLSIFILNIIPMLGLALSIDFALLFINRYREEREHQSIEQAVRKSIETAGRSILFSALCVIIGLAALIVIEVEIFQNIALGGTVVVSLAVLSGLTLLPATIYLLGDKLNAFRLLRIKNTSSRWLSFASTVIKHPIKVIIISLMFFAIALIPIKDIVLTIPSTDSLPPSYESRQTYDQLKKSFNLGEQGQLYVLFEQEQSFLNEEGFTQLFYAQKEIEQMDLVKEITSPFTVANITTIEEWNALYKASPEALSAAITPFINGNSSFMSFTIDATNASSKAQQFVRDFNNHTFFTSAKVSGLPKFNQEIFDEIAQKIVYALLIIVITTFFILMFAFRSILIPIKAIIMNVLGLASTFGILVFIFQYGHFGLNEGTIVLIIPVLVFCLVFGLSMDYEVFLISRIQEEYENGASNTTATINGLVSTSKIITSAALIMIVITGAFAFTDVYPVKQIGVGIAIAIAIDATIIRLLLVPSLMKLFGEWNWWYPFKKSS